MLLYCQNDNNCREYKSKNFKMNIIKKSIFVLIFSSIAFSTNAACKFDLEFGDDASKVLEKYGPPIPMPTLPGLTFLPVPANNICPEQRLNEVAVEYRFLNNKMAAINLRALNDESNSVSDKLTLMKYAKKVYGNFDTGQNPKSYIGYNIFEKPNYFVVYQKMQGGDDAILDEQIYISTTEYDDLLSKYFMKLEEQQAEDMSGN